jgi:hypothetical protein
VSRNPVLSAMAVLVATMLLWLVTTPVSGAVMILTPAGTKVGLTYLDPVDTVKTTPGDSVRFKVAADVVVNGYVVIKHGTLLKGTINKAGHPFPQNAGFANITGLAVTAVDKKTVTLNDIRVSAAYFHGNIRVPAGALVTIGTRVDATVRVP